MVNSVLGMQSCWEQSIVISIVDEIYGTEALMLSAYLSSGTESCGVCLFYQGNLIKWAVWVIYFRDCKKQILENEVGREFEAIDG
ncbi:hypothetical protein CFP56_012817 [Quercus suber]|uniref:Uncharacterized protein n=1 Tax=Quercus suber TaxID=58331 RepID=A0AAW0KX35_QUESU